MRYLTKIKSTDIQIDQSANIKDKSQEDMYKRRKINKIRSRLSFLSVSSI